MTMLSDEEVKEAEAVGIIAFAMLQSIYMMGDRKRDIGGIF
jgi:hypothetical protein